MTIPVDITSAALSPDGTRVATATHGMIKLWDTTTGKSLAAMEADSGARGLAFSPDGKRIAAGLENRRVIVWDIETGKPIAEDVSRSAAIEPGATQRTPWVGGGACDSSTANRLSAPVLRTGAKRSDRSGFMIDRLTAPG
ncbi:MAG: hypothetical protein L0Y71_19290 [Gemmataceae bacterium]|nr:hypothetical protein [Gemmataceae bacterium]